MDMVGQPAFLDVAYERIFDSKTFSSAPIRLLFQDRDGFLWIGTRSGLYRYDGYSLKLYTHDPDDPLSLSGNHILEIIQDPTGMIWIGTESNGLNRFDPGKGIFHRYPFDFDSPDNAVNSIWGLHPDGPTLWAASRDGLLELNTQRGHTIRHRVIEDPDTPDEKRQNMMRQIEDDPSDPDRLWITTLSGLYSFKKSSASFSAHRCPTLPVLYPLEDESDDQYMYSAMEWTGDRMLLGAWGGGHYTYHPHVNAWSRYFFQFKDPALPLSDNVVLQYAQVHDSLYLFAGSALGLLNPFSGEIKLTWLEATDSIFRGSQYAESVILDRNGYAWVGSASGLFRSTTALQNNVALAAPTLIFSAVRIDGALLPDSLISNDHPVFIAPHQQNIHIQFNTISPGTTTGIHYNYMLSGRDESWILAGANRSIQYQDLPGGSYTFRVQAVRESDQTILAESQLQLRVQKYFYTEAWFWLLLTLGILALILYLAWWRIRFFKARYKLQAMYETQLAQSEMAALRAQLNPHFLFNSLNSIKHYIISNEPRIATRYLNKFAALMRLALDNSKNSFIALADEIDFITLFLELEQVRLGDKLRFTIEVDPSLSTQTVQIPPMVIQPYIENAIWHGIVHKTGPGCIELRFIRNDDILEIRIADDGVGREASAAIQGDHKTRKSMGMKLTHDRLALLRQLYKANVTVSIEDLAVANGHASGTLVIIRLPLQEQAHESPIESPHH